MWNVHTRQICRDRSRLMFVRGLGEQMGVIGSDLKWVGRFNGSYLFFLWWAKYLRIRQWWWMYNPVNILFVVLYSLSNIFDPFGTRKHWVTAYKRWTLIFLYKFIYFNWRPITLQYCNGFATHWHEFATGVHLERW